MKQRVEREGRTGRRTGEVNRRIEWDERAGRKIMKSESEDGMRGEKERTELDETTEREENERSKLKGRTRWKMVWTK